tara:strand:+ start:168 stop:1253 length:1086 start_codon:yes stop_codon:yes gene_type:complete
MTAEEKAAQQRKFWEDLASWRNQTPPYTPSGIASLSPKGLPFYPYEEPGRQPDSPGGYDPDEPPHFGVPRDDLNFFGIRTKGLTEEQKADRVRYFAEKAAIADSLEKFTKEKFGVGIRSFSPWQALAGRLGGTDKEKRDLENIRMQQPFLEYLTDDWIAQNPTQLLTGNYRAPDAEPITVSEDIYNIMGRDQTVPTAVPTPQAVVPDTNTSGLGRFLADYHQKTYGQPTLTANPQINTDKFGIPLNTSAGVYRNRMTPQRRADLNTRLNYLQEGLMAIKDVPNYAEIKQARMDKTLAEEEARAEEVGAEQSFRESHAMTQAQDPRQEHQWMAGGGMVNPRPMMGGIGGRGEVLRRMFRRTI